MSSSIKRIAITGGSGQIAYSLLFRLAIGELLGPAQPISLHILELPSALESLKGVVMELKDCAFPLLREIHIGSNPEEVFKGVDYAFLIGAKPRGPGMERKELLAGNGKIFVEQGRALAKVAPQALVLVVGNPCNTNCLIALKNAKGMSSSQFFAMTRLDQNRAVALLAEKTGALVKEIEHVTIWGNHSLTQVPDFLNAKIRGKKAEEVICDRKWCEEVFISSVQKRGAVVIAARGKSSAASAAHAALEAMHSLIYPTKPGQFFSMSLLAGKNPYGINPDIVFSFPCISKGEGKVEIVPGLMLDAFLKSKIVLSEKELLEEKKLIKDLIL